MVGGSLDNYQLFSRIFKQKTCKTNNKECILYEQNSAAGFFLLNDFWKKTTNDVTPGLKWGLRQEDRLNILSDKLNLPSAHEPPQKVRKNIHSHAIRCQRQNCNI